MKRYIKLFLVSVITLGLIVFVFFILIKQDNSYITYIKFQVNPSFVIGINNDKKVIFFNALNEDGNKYNLAMFSGKTLNEAMQVFIEKLKTISADKREIALSVMTKNHVLEKDIYQVIVKEITSYDANYQVTLIEPLPDELEKYSSEVVYNLKRSLNNDKLKEIGGKIYSNLDNYVTNKISKLNLSKVNKEKKKTILQEKIQSGYFNDFVIANLSFKEDNITLLARSNYKISFTFNEDGTYAYTLVLYLAMDYEKKNDKTIVETYQFDYEKKDDVASVRNLKVYYYTF